MNLPTVPRPALLAEVESAVTAELPRSYAVAEVTGPRKDEAAARVPIALGRGTNLLGPVELLRRRVAEYRAAGVTTFQAKLSGSLDERLATLATLIEICEEPA